MIYSVQQEIRNRRKSDRTGQQRKHHESDTISKAIAIVFLIREAAECLGISEKRVYRLIQDGTLNGKKIGKAWFIRYADIASYEKED